MMYFGAKMKSQQKGRMKMRIRAAVILIILMSFLTVIHPRAENGVYIGVSYSMDITASPDDRFALTYRYVGGEETATIEVNAYDINGKQGKITLGEGDYEISGIRYLGENIDIESKGYGCISNFHIHEGEDYSSIKISIGKSACDSLMNNYGNVLFRQNEQLVDVITDTVPETTEAAVGSTESSEPVSTDGSTELTEQRYSTTIAELVTQEQPTEAAVTTEDTTEAAMENEQDTEQPQKNGSVIGKMLPFLLLLVILFIGIYIYVKKTGKIIK